MNLKTTASFNTQKIGSKFHVHKKPSDIRHSEWKRKKKRKLERYSTRENCSVEKQFFNYKTYLLELHKRLIHEFSQFRKTIHHFSQDISIFCSHRQNIPNE